MTKNEKMAAEAFKNHPNADKVIVCEDGNVFLNENAAQLHANKNATGKVLALETFYKEGLKGTADDAKAKAEADKKAAEAKAKAEADKKAAEVKAKAAAQKSTGKPAGSPEIR